MGAPDQMPPEASTLEPALSGARQGRSPVTREQTLIHLIRHLPPRSRSNSPPMLASNSSLPPAKRRKVAANNNDDLEHIQRLEILLLQAVAERTSLNPLVDLLDAAKNAAPPHFLFKCMYALYRVFASIIDAGMLVPTLDPGAKVVRAWISERLNLFTDMLLGFMSDSEKPLRVSFFPICSFYMSATLSRPQLHESSSPFSAIYPLLCPKARIHRRLLISLSTYLTSIRSSEDCSNVPQAPAYRLIGPNNCSIPMFSKFLHQPGLTPTTILGGFSSEMQRTSIHYFFSLNPSSRDLVLSSPSVSRTPTPTSHKIS